MGSNFNELGHSNDAEIERKIDNETGGYGVVRGAVEPSRRVAVHRFHGLPILTRDREPILQVRQTEALQRQNAQALVMGGAFALRPSTTVPHTPVRDGVRRGPRNTNNINNVNGAVAVRNNVRVARRNHLYQYGLFSKEHFEIRYVFSTFLFRF